MLVKPSERNNQQAFAHIDYRCQTSRAHVVSTRSGQRALLGYYSCTPAARETLRKQPRNQALD